MSLQSRTDKLNFLILYKVSSYILFFIEFTGATLVHKIMLFSEVQFYYTSSLCCTVHSPLPVKSPSITIYARYHLVYLSPPPFSLVITTVVCVYEGFFSFFLLNPFTFFTNTHTEALVDHTDAPETACVISFI